MGRPVTVRGIVGAGALSVCLAGVVAACTAQRALAVPETGEEALVAPPRTQGDAEPPRDGPPPLGAAWIDAVHERFHDRWHGGVLAPAAGTLPAGHPMNDRAREVHLRIAVKRDGRVRRVEVSRPSGVAELDHAARELVLEAAPLPPPPADLLSDDNLVHLQWRFARDERAEGVAGARVERVEWPIARAVPALLAAGRIPVAARRLLAAWQDTPADQARVLARTVGIAQLEVLLADDVEEPIRTQAVAAVARSGVPSAVAHVRVLAGAVERPGLCDAAIHALGALGDAESAPLLLARLQALDARAGSAARALLALGETGRVSAVLGRALDGPHRDTALAILEEVAVPELAEPLLALASDAKVPRAVRAGALRALAPLAGDGRSPAARALVRALAEPDALVRAAAATGLARLGKAGLRSRGLFFQVLPRLADPDPRVRGGLAIAVAHFDPKGALRELSLRLRRERDGAALAALATAVASIEGADAVRELEWLVNKHRETRGPAFAALVARVRRHPDPALAGVVRRLADPGDPAAAALLLGLASDVSPALSSPVVEVRAAAFAALAERRDSTAPAAALHALALPDAGPVLVSAAEILAQR